MVIFYSFIITAGCSQYDLEYKQYSIYDGKIAVQGNHSYIIYDYWANLLENQNSELVFDHFYRLLITFSQPEVVKSVKVSFLAFCQAHELEDKWLKFIENKT